MKRTVLATMAMVGLLTSATASEAEETEDLMGVYVNANIPGGASYLSILPGTGIPPEYVAGLSLDPTKSYVHMSFDPRNLVPGRYHSLNNSGTSSQTMELEENGAVLFGAPGGYTVGAEVPLLAETPAPVTTNANANTPVCWQTARLQPSSGDAGIGAQLQALLAPLANDASGTRRRYLIDLRGLSDAEKAAVLLNLPEGTVRIQMIAEE